MSDSVIKGERKASARPAAPSSSSSSAARSRKTTSGTARAVTLAKSSPAGKAPARKAAKPSPPTPSKVKTTNSKQRLDATKTTKSSPTAKKPSKSSAQDTRAKPATKSTSASKVVAAKKIAKTKQQSSAPQKKQTPAPAKTKSTGKQAPAVRATANKARPARSATGATNAAARKPLPNTHATPMQLVRQPTRDEAAALQAFERAHKEFARGRFTEAATQFRLIIERFSVAEVTARARTYLAVAEARQRSEQSPPETADALYDGGVLELNRANYIGAQELFERALGRDATAAHIHYALAVTRARIGSRQPAFDALERALELQPNLRARATQDTDLASLRNDAEFERIVFNSRS